MAGPYDTLYVSSFEASTISTGFVYSESTSTLSLWANTIRVGEELPNFAGTYPHWFWTSAGGSLRRQAISTTTSDYAIRTEQLATNGEFNDSFSLSNVGTYAYKKVSFSNGLLYFHNYGGSLAASNAALQISSYQVFVRNELFTSSLTAYSSITTDTTVANTLNVSSVSSGYLFADAANMNKATLSSIQFISTLLFQDPNTTSLFSMGLQTNKTDTFPQGTVNSSTTALSLPAPNTNFGLYMGVNDSGVAYIVNLSSSDTPFSTLALLAEDVVISSLLVSSINGQLPGSGSVGPELAVSTLTASTISTGFITTENASVSSFTVSSINGQVPGSVSPDLTLSTLKVSSIILSEFALQVSTASTVIAAYALGDTQAVFGLQPQSQSVSLTADNTTSTFTIQQSIDGSPTGSIQFTPSSLLISSADVFIPTHLTTSSLTVSSINGQLPGGSVSSDLTLSTLLVSSSVIAKEQLQVSTPSTLLRMYTNLDTNAYLELTPQTHTAFFNVNTINSSFTIQHGIDGTPTGIIKFGPSTLTISSTEVVVPTTLTAYHIAASTVSSGNAFIGESLYATKAKFGPQIDVVGAAENKHPFIFDATGGNTIYIAKVSTLNNGEYNKQTILSQEAYDASLRYSNASVVGMEYFQPSTGFSFRVGSELYDVNDHQLQISSQQVFVRSELLTSSLIVSSINGQQPGGGSVGPTLELSTLAVSSVSSIFINTDVLNANVLNVSSIPGSAIQAFSLPWSKMQQTGNLTVYAGTWTHGGTLSISNLSVSSSYTVNDLQANTMTVRTNAVICTIIGPAISTIWISAASAYIQGIDFYNASGNSLTVSNLNAGSLGFTNLNARNITASTATLSSFFTNTHTTSSLFASQGISTNEIFASSISTYSMSVYGPNTLTVSGNAYFTKEIIMSSLIVTGGLQISTTGTNTFDTTNATISSLTVSSINGSAYTPGGGGGGTVTNTYSTLFTSSFQASSITMNGILYASTIETVPITAASTSYYYAGANNPEDGTTLRYSTDGSNWSALGSFTEGIEYITVANNTVVLSKGGSAGVNTLYKSQNGLSFTNISIAGATTGGMTKPFYANGYWLLGEANTSNLWISQDLSSWTSNTNIPPDGGQLNAFAYDPYGQVWVGVGKPEGGPRSTILYCAGNDPTTIWNQQEDPGLNLNGIDVVFGKGSTAAASTFVMITGLGPVYKSTDGSNWTGFTTSPTLSKGYTVAYGNGVFLAGGTDATSNTLWRCTDGETWIAASSNPLAGSVISLTYTSNLYVAVGVSANSGKPISTICTSSDGDTWTVATGQFLDVNGTAAGSGIISATNQGPVNVPTISSQNTYTGTVTTSQLTLNDQNAVDTYSLTASSASLLFRGSTVSVGSPPNSFTTLYTSSFNTSTITFLDQSNTATSATLSNYDSNLYFNTYQMINSLNLTSTVESLLGMISTLSTALAIATLNIQTIP